MRPDNQRRKERAANDPKFRAHLAVKQREWRDANREKLLDRNVERYRDDAEYRERKIASASKRQQKLYDSDPDFRAAKLAAQKVYRQTHPENRVRHRERLRERYATDPEYRAHVLAQGRAAYHKRRKLLLEKAEGR